MMALALLAMAITRVVSSDLKGFKLRLQYDNA